MAESSLRIPRLSSSSLLTKAESEPFKSSRFEEADPGGRDPFDLTIFDQELACRLNQVPYKTKVLIA